MAHGNGGAMFSRISNTGAAPARGDTLLVEGNRLPPGLPIFRFDNVPEWKNTGYLRLRGNIGGATLAEAIAFVTANDTVTCYVRNSTGAPSPALGGTHGFYLDIERR